MKRILLYILISITGSISCKKFVTVDFPSSRIGSETVFDNDVTATAAALGMYEKTTNIGSFAASGALSSVTSLCAIAADEMDNYLSTHVEVAANDMTAVTAPVISVWSSAYSTIYVTNMVIEGVTRSTSMTAATKTQLEGEAKFIRAFSYFYLINLFGDVPLATSTDYRVNAVAGRTPVAKVYEQVIKDLEDARTKLGDDYITADRARPNKWAATALLARVYLYLGDWANAEITATSIINNTARYSLAPDLDNVFLADSPEAIWQLASNAGYYNSYEGLYWILTSDPYIASLNTGFAVNSFEPGDNRKIKWVGTFNGSQLFYYPYKYKIKYNSGNTHSEQPAVLRLAEQFLIRAEARAHQNKLTGPNSAESDINTIRNRAGLGNTTASTQPQLLAAVEQERKVELFSEWGHRWFDLKRTGRATAVLSAIKPAWQPTDTLFPLPEVEMMNDPNLKPQNPGY